jgi:hypothetical protein
MVVLEFIVQPHRTILLALAGSAVAAAAAMGRQESGSSPVQKTDEIAISAARAELLRSLADELAAVLLSGDESIWVSAEAPELDDLLLAIEPHVQARAVRVDLADRRGLAARAQYCDRRASRSAGERSPIGGGPTIIPSPGSMVLLIVGSVGAMSRRRVRSSSPRSPGAAIGQGTA